VANFGSHAALLATNLSSSLACPLCAHEPVISGIQMWFAVQEGAKDNNPSGMVQIKIAAVLSTMRKRLGDPKIGTMEK
jgi:hypothetical protein